MLQERKYAAANPVYYKGPQVSQLPKQAIRAVRGTLPVEWLEPQIEANGERIDRNGELIAQLRERMAAVEVRVGALEDIVRFFHPPGGDSPQGP